MNSFNCTRIYSIKSPKRKNYSKYIPIGNIHFRHKNILRDYLECFDTFLIADQYLNISEVIFLINQAKKSSIDSAFFIMVIAMEKLSDKFLESPFRVKGNETIIENSEFEKLIKETKESFQKSFKDLKSNAPQKYHNLFSKLGSINKKGKTDNKIDLLLKFAEINKTPEIENLFPILRNIAIHKGEIDFPEGKAYENYIALEKLLNDVIANLIQYKGLRYIKTIATINYSEQKEKYQFDYNPYRL
jgi:hypothetical protein